MQAAQVCSWLEPAMLSHLLPLAGRDRINRTEFDRMVLTLEPQLAAADVERLWRIHGPSPEMSLAELVHFSPTQGGDSWAEAALRRVARRLAPALTTPPDTFRRFNLTSITGLSYGEFEGLLLAQDPRMTRDDVIALWRLTDADGNGRVDLGEVVSVLRRAQLEGLTQGRPLPQPPASPVDRDMILEAHVAQIDRSFRNRGVMLPGFRVCDLHNENHHRPEPQRRFESGESQKSELHRWTNKNGQESLLRRPLQPLA
ncbi:unnamed protein product [Symbiodinium natans]|uniref:EF-hand domain-containing protein n=1 Tax=Symbiodinium natans TaxID=878477 RepID=A0A812I2F2_9DINO|nr:unnamed protein product [Symbiodinium natans]